MSILRKIKNLLAVNSNTLNNQVMKTNLKRAKTFNTDLVEADYFNGCCGECAKYRGRWFSISGKDKRFPKMPENYGCTCQGIDFYPVVEGASEPNYCPKGVDIVEYSNRPFVDDRTKNEKELYQHYLDSEVYESIKYQDKEDYERLLQLIPNDMPKSFSAYRRMKISKTANFLKISEKAKSFDMDIILTSEQKAIIDRYNKYEKVLKQK